MEPAKEGEIVKNVVVINRNCSICGADEREKLCTRCDHVKARFAELQKEISQLNKYVRSIQSEVKLLLIDHKDDLLTKEEVTITTKRLRALWDATDNYDGRTETIHEFIGTQLSRSFIVTFALNLFLKLSDNKTLAETLQELRDACVEWQKLHKDETKLLSVEELMKLVEVPKKKKGFWSQVFKFLGLTK